MRMLNFLKYTPSGTQSTIIFLAEDYIKEMACKTERNKMKLYKIFPVFKRKIYLTSFT